MEIKEQKLKVEFVAQNWTSRTLRVNPEYQRGLVWTPVQKQRLVDSVFRGYPLPSFYFRVTEHKGPDGNPTKVWEIVDGQQRIEALAGYLRDEWPALAKNDPKLSLPDAIRGVHSPWAGKLFSQLSSDDKRGFKDAEIQGLVITSVNSEDEVRDLFIRLQAGTALTRQQIRDAWPGPIGPFVESLAGRSARRPSFAVFSWIDRRGTRRTEELDETEDEYVSDRQTCAQLLTLYFARDRMADPMPSLAARFLDDMYHQNTSFDPDGDKARRFKELLAWCQRIIVTEGQSQVIRKNRLFSLFTFLDDLSRNPTVRVNDDLIQRTSHEFWSDHDEDEPRGGKVISATTLTEHYDWFVRKKMANLSVPGLDPKRLFDDVQKDQIWKQATDAKGIVKCASCSNSITRDMAEFNHKIPWIRGGKTEVSNGEVVHIDCHLRGRAAAQVIRT